jgi:hypothetical protein
MNQFLTIKNLLKNILFNRTKTKGGMNMKTSERDWIIANAKNYIDEHNPPCIKSRHFSAVLMADFYLYFKNKEDHK